MRTPAHKTTFVIERLWINERANHVSESCGFEPVGFVDTREEAVAAVGKGGRCPGSTSFLVPEGVPYLRYREVPKLNVATIKPGPLKRPVALSAH